MRCLISLALGLLALKAVLALDPAFISPVQVMCPEPSSSEEMPCTPACLTDEDCLSNTKCCPSACGLSCRTPIIEAAPKAGSCPWVNNQISQLCQEEDECSRDSECYGDKKCCMSNCARRCLDPVQGIQSPAILSLEVRGSAGISNLLILWLVFLETIPHLKLKR
uniref:WAP domain-containing protein n=1 Tax=Spermophilus dauricus TaxID=99837 RepID=A0A8C9Q1A3_SPEDA